LTRNRLGGLLDLSSAATIKLEEIEKPGNALYLSSLTENLVRPPHQCHQIGRSYEPGILACEVGVENHTGP
jgi:hypothetical protein